MNFKSFEFVVFFAVVYALTLLLRRWITGRNVLLLGASYYFYGYWDAKFLVLIYLSTAIDYVAALGIVGERLSWLRRAGISALLVLSGLALVGVNWEAVRAGTYDWSFGDILWPSHTGARPAIIACYVVALLWPLINEGMFRLGETGRKRAFLLASLVANLGLLGFFKYYGFFVTSAVAVLQRFGIEAHPHVLEIVLPVGISFYTFQTLSYTIDVYRGQMGAERNLLSFALYVAFFPQLVAGPIERASHLLPQMSRVLPITRWHVYTGFWLLGWGMFKKVVLADNAALICDGVFAAFAGDKPPEGAGFTAWLGVYAFAIQIYCDFSAYSDIARGTARMMGFDLMLNFNLPYFAVNPSDFWRRWHISLSTWLRDYLYIPLGGNRKGPVRTYVNLMATMVLGGLWHGAAWTFVLWGIYHGGLLAIHRMLQGHFERWYAFKHKWMRDLWKVIMIVFFFHLTCLGWLLFRARSMDQLWAMTRAMFTDLGSQVDLMGPSGGISLAALMIFLFVVQFIQYRSRDLMIVFRWPLAIRAAVYAALMLGFVLFGAFGESPFIYFQF